MITKISKELLIRRISIAPWECQLQVCYYSAFNSSSKWCFHSNCGNGSGFLRTALQRLWTRSGSHHIWKWHTCPVCQMDGSTPAGTAPALRVCPCDPVCHQPVCCSQWLFSKTIQNSDCKDPSVYLYGRSRNETKSLPAQQGLWDSMVISLSLFIMVWQLRGNTSRVWFLSSPIHEEKLKIILQYKNALKKCVDKRGPWSALGMAPVGLCSTPGCDVEESIVFNLLEYTVTYILRRRRWNI